MNIINNLHELILKPKVICKQSDSESDNKRIDIDALGLNLKNGPNEDSFEKTVNEDIEILKNNTGKDKTEESSENKKLILDGNNANKIIECIQSKIDTSTLPDNADMNNSRLIVNDKGEVVALSFKLTDEKGTPCGNVEYDTDGNIKHFGLIKFLEDGKFSIDEKYYDKNGNLIISNDSDEKSYDRNYEVSDLKEVLNIINNLKEYNMILDANADGVIDILDLQYIGFNLSSELSISDIKKLNLLSPSNNYLMDINCSIDNSKQGQVGDCWLLTTLNALSYTEKGRQIIEDAITTNDDGTYTVNFPGVDTSITITDAELAKIRETGEYSKGDDDVLLMEIATERVMDLIKNGKIDAPDSIKNAAIYGSTSISGGWLSDMIYLLTGDDAKFTNGSSNIEELFEKMKNNPEEYAAMMLFEADDSGNNSVIMDVDGNNVELVTGHAWGIKSVDEDTVTIVNPWDSSKEYTISKEELIKHIGCINYYELSEYEGKKECSKNFKYDEDGNRFEITEKRDEDGNLVSITKDSYDKDGNLIKTVSSYDQNGNISEVAETKYDSNGVITELLITENTYDNEGNITGVIRKTYDENGILISSEESEYDKNGNEVKSTTKRADGTVEQTVETKYDSNSNITTKTIVEYDVNGEVISTTEEIYDENGGMESKTYNRNGKVIAKREVVKDSDGRAISENGYTYDENGNIVTQEVVYYDNGKRVGSSVRTYDLQGKEIKIEQYNADGTLDCTQEIVYDKTGGKTVTKTKYDKNGKVIEVTVTKYDKDGNEIT